MGKEADLEAALRVYAKKRGCIFYKFVSPGHSGVPDRLIIGPTGKLLFLELKAPGRRPTTLQRLEIKKLTEQGVNATWTDSFTVGMDLIDALLK